MKWIPPVLDSCHYKSMRRDVCTESWVGRSARFKTMRKYNDGEKLSVGWLNVFHHRDVGISYVSPSVITLSIIISKEIYHSPTKLAFCQRNGYGIRQLLRNPRRTFDAVNISPIERHFPVFCFFVLFCFFVFFKIQILIQITWIKEKHLRKHRSAWLDRTCDTGIRCRVRRSLCRYIQQHISLYILKNNSLKMIKHKLQWIGWNLPDGIGMCVLPW